MMNSVIKACIKAYRMTLSPLKPATCRFVPTCSEYALQALETHGALKATALILRRISRCHPWGGCGYDPVPLHSSHVKSSE